MQFIFLSPNVKIWFVLLFLEGKFVCKIPKLKWNLERLWVITADEKKTNGCTQMSHEINPQQNVCVRLHLFPNEQSKKILNGCAATTNDTNQSN